MNAEIAVTLMEELGLQIDRGKDGIRYVSAIEQKPAGTYDLILMDIQMPNMGGYKATQIIRGFSDKEKANIPIVAMTANAFEEDTKRALSVGMNAHIAKPIDMKKVEEVLLEILKDKGNL
ncbi:response regulator [Clostridium sp. OF09-10]|jgi:CheY-like chemotaxis protein|nr:MULTISPECIES: response regulator [unclassified Clostridium]RHS68448.1 response regulator [Clostridium sp. AM45-5]RHW02541.1 response regulator [Clostridium sp. OF09-10]